MILWNRKDFPPEKSPPFSANACRKRIAGPLLSRTSPYVRCPDMLTNTALPISEDRSIKAGFAANPGKKNVGTADAIRRTINGKNQAAAPETCDKTLIQKRLPYGAEFPTPTKRPVTFFRIFLSGSFSPALPSTVPAPAGSCQNPDNCILPREGHGPQGTAEDPAAPWRKTVRSRLHSEIQTAAPSA